MNDASRKLRFACAAQALAYNLPDEAASLVSAMRAESARVYREPNGTYPFVIAFARSMAEARQGAATVAEAVEGDGLLWLCYPKGTSKRYPKPDLNRDSLWPVYHGFGMRPVAQVALDDDWSAMRFRRTEFVKPKQ